MRARYATAAILSFLAICSAEGKDCSQVGKDASAKASIDFVRNLIATSEYSCAVQTTTMLARSFASSPNDRNGFDARFALRELALEEDKNSNIPPSFRIKLTKAAAGSFQRNKPIPEVELIADIRFLLNAMKELQGRGEISGWLDILGDAIQLNQQLPHEEHAIVSWELNGINDAMQEVVYKNYSVDEWESLEKIAEISRGDTGLMVFRSQLASWFHYWVPGLYDDRPREEIIARSKYILRLTEQLNDAPTGFPTTDQCKTGRIGDHGCYMDWQSRPYIRAGLALHHVGMESEAKRYVEKGLKVIESESNLNFRLALYNYVIRDLIREHYDRSTLDEVSARMQTLADSLGPKFSEEIRSNLANHRYGRW
jgi:hypothetical protein